MDSRQEYLEQQLTYVAAVEHALMQSIAAGTEMLRLHGAPDPTYVASAGVMAVLVRIIVAFLVTDGMTQEHAEAKAKTLLQPIADTVDNAYWSAIKKRMDEQVSMN